MRFVLRIREEGKEGWRFASECIFSTRAVGSFQRLMQFFKTAILFVLIIALEFNAKSGVNSTKKLRDKS